MKVTIQTSDLAAILGLANAMLKSGDPVRIVAERIGENIDEGLCDPSETEPESGTLRIVAFNDATVCEWRRPAEISRPGSVALDGATLEKFVKASIKSDATLMLETHDVDNARALRINSARASHEFDCVPEDIFEKIAPGRVEGEMADLTNFARSLGIAQIAAASEGEANGSRVALTGVHIRTRDGAIDLVGTDGKRLALARLRAVDIPAVDLSAVPDGATIPGRVIALLVRVLTGGPARLRIDEASIVVEGRDGAISARLIDAPFPDYSRLLGIGTSESIEIDGEALATALARTSASIGREDRFTAAQIARDDEGVHLISRTAHQSSSETLSEAGGEPAAIGFDTRYVTAALRGIAARRIEFRFSDAGTPIYLSSPERKDVTMLVMPMRV